MYLYMYVFVCICMSYYSVSCQFAGISITLYGLKLKSFLIVCHECIQLRSIQFQVYSAIRCSFPRLI